MASRKQPDSELEFEERKARRGLRDEKHIRFSTRLGRPDYQKKLTSKAPQAVFKVIRFGRGANMKKLLNYVAQENDKGETLQLEDQDGLKISGKDFDDLYENWSREFERKKPGAKRQPRHFVHMVLSADTVNSNAEKVTMAGRDFLQTNFGDEGYEYVFVTHTDRKNPHIHVTLKLKNSETGRKLHFSKAATFDMREQWSKALQSQGLEHVATMRRDRTEVLENVAKGVEQVKKRAGWHTSVMANAPGGLSLTQRNQLFRRVTHMQKLVKQATHLFEPVRKKHLADLRKLGDQVRSGTPKEIQESAKASHRTMARDVRQLNSLLAEMSTPMREYKEMKIAKAKVVRQAKHLGDAINRDVKAAVEYVKKDTSLTRAEKKTIVLSLQPYVAAVQRVFRSAPARKLGVEKSLERDR